MYIIYTYTYDFKISVWLFQVLETRFKYQLDLLKTQAAFTCS